MNARYNAGRGRVHWQDDRHIFAALVSAEYKFSETHRSLDALPGVIGSPIEVVEREIDAEGYACAAPLRFPRVLSDKRAAGVVVYAKSKRDTTLIAYFGDIDSFPITPNGGDIDVAWPEDKLFRL